MPIPVLILLAVLVSIGTARAAPLTDLPAPVRSVLQKHKLKTDGLSVYVQDIAERAPLLTLNARVARNPASVMKLVTTLVALDTLGPAYRMRTDVFTDVEPVDGVVKGNLYLKGHGDPFLVTEAFWRLLKDLRHLGLRHVTGDLVLDGSYFKVPRRYRGDFDGKPHRAYNVMPHASLVNFFATHFKFYPDRSAGSVRIVIDPPMTTLRLENKIQLVKGRCSSKRRRIKMHLVSLEPVPEVRFSGRLSENCEETRLLRAVAGPVPFVFGAFKPMWEEMGGRIDGSGRSGRVPGEAKLFHRTSSKPMAELVRIMNKYSNNVMTRNLLLVLGARTYGAPGTLDKGRRAVSEWLSANQVGAPELLVDNGSGLSRRGQVSALSLARVLIKGARGDFGAEFASSLPLSALDGTLRKRLRKTDLAGKARMKTGLLNGVRSIAGFLRTRSGRDLVVVSLHNETGVQNGGGTAVQDALLEWLFEQ